MTARTSSSPSIGGVKTLYIFSIVFENDIAFALIWNMPDNTLTMHLSWQTLAISNCSAYIKSFNSSGISPIQRLFARAIIGILLLSRDSMHTEQTPLQPGAKIGPLNSLTGSELLHLDFLVTPSTLSKLIFSTSESSSISRIGVNFPQTAQPASSNTSEEVSLQKPDTIFCFNFADGGAGGNSHISWTDSASVMTSYAIV